MIALKISSEIILDKIYFIRQQKVMINSDLADLYQAETKRLNEQVKRNIKRFPQDLMFQLTQKEADNLMSQIASSSWGEMISVKKESLDAIQKLAKVLFYAEIAGIAAEKINDEERFTRIAAINRGTSERKRRRNFLLKQKEFLLLFAVKK
jgi:hypothetical protein